MVADWGCVVLKETFDALSSCPPTEHTAPVEPETPLSQSSVCIWTITELNGSVSHSRAVCCYSCHLMSSSHVNAHSFAYCSYVWQASSCWCHSCSMWSSFTFLLNMNGSLIILSFTPLSDYNCMTFFFTSFAHSHSYSCFCWCSLSTESLLSHRLNLYDKTLSWKHTKGKNWIRRLTCSNVAFPFTYSGFKYCRAAITVSVYFSHFKRTLFIWTRPPFRHTFQLPGRVLTWVKNVILCKISECIKPNTVCLYSVYPAFNSVFRYCIHTVTPFKSPSLLKLWHNHQRNLHTHAASAFSAAYCWCDREKTWSDVAGWGLQLQAFTYAYTHTHTHTHTMQALSRWIKQGGCDQRNDAWQGQLC